MISHDSTLFRILTPALALSLCAGVATAQNQTRDRDRDRDQDQRQQDRQAQQDRGANQPGDDRRPLWRQPTDDREQWQPQDRWTQQRDRMGQQPGQRDQTGMETYRTAYWEGYHDGFHDDEFGYDHWNDQWDRQYSSAYTDGYYDGYYDQQSDYAYDPNYYIYSVAVVPTAEANQDRTERQRAEQRREGDETRARGDRRLTASGSSGRMAQAEMEKVAAIKLVRGDVSQISEAERSEYPDHTVLKIDFQDREAVIADFGPQMKRDRLPFERGDRVSLVGYHSKSDRGETIVVSQIAHEGKVYKLRGAEDTLEQRDGQTDRQRDQRDRERPQRPGGGG